ncbi:unnamed protein product [Rotaria socialis]|nr:unnamed protein product [Rotaria socialis]
MMGFQQRELLLDYFPPRASLASNAIKLEYTIGISISSGLLSNIESNRSPISNQDSPSELSPISNRSELSTANTKISKTLEPSELNVSIMKTYFH